MTDTVIAHVRALEPGEGVIAAWLAVQQGKIVDIGSSDKTVPNAAEVIDGGGRLLTPGLIDVHTHGLEQYCYEAGPQELLAASRRLGRYGVTCVLPTLFQNVSREHLGEVERLAAALDEVQDVSMPGLHFEGPFLALPGAGACMIPGDVGLVEELWSAARGRIAVMSVSPETTNILPVIERLCERGVVVFLTHTRATPRQTQAALDAGARHATHFYDVFPVPDAVEPGVRPVGAVEAILADRRATVDMIADGVHVDPVGIRAIAAAKGYERTILISDANVGAGLPPGVYPTPSGQIVTGTVARLRQPGSPYDGALSGSVLTMDRGVANLLAWLDWPEEQVWATASRNPARLLRLSAKGALRVGADADLVLWDRTADGLHAARTWVAGRCVYQSSP